MRDGMSDGLDWSGLVEPHSMRYTTIHETDDDNDSFISPLHILS